MFAIEEELWFGDSADDASEAKAARSMAAMGGRILGAKPFPIAAKRLAELTRNPSSRIDQVVRVLEGDPALSARLLRLVNSAGYALRVRCTSVRHAAALVGVGRLHQLATTAAILDMFDANSKHSIALLGHAAVVGSLCRYLAVHLSLPPDELFTCGFLHDIGKLMLLDSEGDRYATLLTQYGDMPDQIHRYEREVFGFDHAVLGAHVLSAWNIPEPVPRVVAWHHNTPRAYKAGGAIVSMVQTLRLADELSYSLAIEPMEDAIAATAAGDAAGYLDISEPQLARMWADLRSLRERALSHGASDDADIVPREMHVVRALPSLRPPESAREPALESEPPLENAESQIIRTAAAPSQPRGEVSAVPQHFPCLVCQKASFGSRCALCSGHVCPEHIMGPEDWCALCAREYVLARETAKTSPGVKLALGVVIGVSVIAAVLGAALAPEISWVSVVVGPLLLLALWMVLLAVGGRVWVSYHFRRARAARRLPRAEAKPVVKAPVMAWPAPRITAIDVDAPTDPPPASLVDPLGATNRPPAPSSSSADLFVIAANRTRDAASILDLDKEFSLTEPENDQVRQAPNSSLEQPPASTPQAPPVSDAEPAKPRSKRRASSKRAFAQVPASVGAPPNVELATPPRELPVATAAAEPEITGLGHAATDEPEQAAVQLAAESVPAAVVSTEEAVTPLAQVPETAQQAELAGDTGATPGSTPASDAELSASADALNDTSALHDAPPASDAEAAPASRTEDSALVAATLGEPERTGQSSLDSTPEAEASDGALAHEIEPVRAEPSVDAELMSVTSAEPSVDAESTSITSGAEAAFEAAPVSSAESASSSSSEDVVELGSPGVDAAELSVELGLTAESASTTPDSVSETETAPDSDAGDASDALSVALPTAAVAAKPSGLAALAVQRRPPVASTARLFG